MGKGTCKSCRSYMEKGSGQLSNLLTGMPSTSGQVCPKAGPSYHRPTLRRVKPVGLQGRAQGDPVSLPHLGQPTNSPGYLSESDQQCVSGPSSLGDLRWTFDTKLPDQCVMRTWTTSTLPNHRTSKPNYPSRVGKNIPNCKPIFLRAKIPTQLP